ncbi:hypothetical protein [Pseudomonas sp. TWP3-2]|uniref:hypothetical protein n=1 Tax=Pseudomonas sp. TWP3-2 TaxID=2804574 RepID=UPI003CF91A2B
MSPSSGRTTSKCWTVGQELITRLFTDGAISIDEFNHYCKRLRDICQQRKEAA